MNRITTDRKLESLTDLLCDAYNTTQNQEVMELLDKALNIVDHIQVQEIFPTSNEAVGTITWIGDVRDSGRTAGNTYRQYIINTWAKRGETDSFVFILNKNKDKDQIKEYEHIKVGDTVKVRYRSKAIHKPDKGVAFTRTQVSSIYYATDEDLAQYQQRQHQQY